METSWKEVTRQRDRDEPVLAKNLRESIQAPNGLSTGKTRSRRRETPSAGLQFQDQAA